MTHKMLIFTSLVANSSNILAHTYERTSLLATCIACRFASKKAGGSSRNTSGKCRPKHRGLKVCENQHVSAGSILVLQRNLRFHPGLNVGFGKNGTLFALEHGRVVISSEKVDPNLEHTWVQRLYSGRDFTNIYKKYLNVIAEPQHCRFKLIDQI